MDTDSRPDVPRMNDRRAQLRAEALRQLRWQQQQWQQVLAQAPLGSPVLTSRADRDWFHSVLDLLRRAGEEVPQAFYRRGSVVPASRAKGRATASISLTALVADVARVLEVFAKDADENPDASASTSG
jgi:hypothetical protein